MPDRQIKGRPGGQASLILPHYKLLQATRAPGTALLPLGISLLLQSVLSLRNSPKFPV